MATDDRENWREWAAAFEAVAWLVVVRIALAIAPFRRTATWATSAARAMGPDAQDATDGSDAQLARAVRRGARVVRGSACLPQAIAGMLLAARRGRRSLVRIGVRGGVAEPFGAHAWLETARGTPIGGSEAVAFTPLTALDPFASTP